MQWKEHIDALRIISDKKALNGVITGVELRDVSLAIELFPLYDWGPNIDIVPRRQTQHLSKESDMELNSLLSGFLKALAHSVL